MPVPEQRSAAANMSKVQATDLPTEKRHNDEYYITKSAILVP